MSEIKVAVNKWRDNPCSWVRRPSIAKRSVRFFFFNLTQRINICPNKIPANYFVDINKLILKFIQRSKRHRIASTILKQKNKGGELTVFDFKDYYKATVIKTVWHWKKEQTSLSVEKDRKPRNKFYKYSPLIFNKGTKIIQWSKK